MCLITCHSRTPAITVAIVQAAQVHAMIAEERAHVATRITPVTSEPNWNVLISEERIKVMAHHAILTHAVEVRVVATVFAQFNLMNPHVLRVREHIITGMELRAAIQMWIAETLGVALMLIRHAIQRSLAKNVSFSLPEDFVWKETHYAATP